MPPAQASGLPKLKRSSSDFALSHSAKASRLLSPDDVDAVLATECCKHKCIGQLPRPLLEDLRKRYVQLRTERARTEWLSMELAMLRHSPVQRRLHYSLFGRPVCRHAFQLALDLSNDKMEAAYNKALDNVRNDAVLRSSATPRDTPASDSVYAFFCMQRETVCDPVPSAKGVTYIWPQWWPWKAGIYAEYVGWARARSPLLAAQVASFATFAAVRKKHFSNMVRPRKSTLSRCSTCERLRAKRMQAMTAQEFDLYKAEMKERTDFHIRERRNLHAAIERSASRDDELALSCDYTEDLKLPQIRLPSVPKVAYLKLHFCQYCLLYETCACVTQ